MVQHLHVVDQPAHEVAGLVAVEEAFVQPLQGREDPHAEVGQHDLGHPPDHAELPDEAMNPTR